MERSSIEYERKPSKPKKLMKKFLQKGRRKFRSNEGKHHNPSANFISRSNLGGRERKITKLEKYENEHMLDEWKAKYRKFYEHYIKRVRRFRINVGHRKFWRNFLNYSRIHLIYVTFVALISGLIVFLCEIGNTDINFIDALFIGTSATTSTGLVTQDISTFRSATKAMIFLMFFLCGQVSESLNPIIVHFCKIRWGTYKAITRTGLTEDEIVTTDDEGGREKNFKSGKDKKKKKKIKKSIFFIHYLKCKEGYYQYKAVKHLFVWIVAYLVIIQIIALIIQGLYLQFSEAGEIFTDAGINVWRAAAFHNMSAFSGVGMTLLPTGITEFYNAWVFVIVLAVLALVGDALYPVLLRFFLWIFYRIILKFRARESMRHMANVYRYLLANSRYVGTHLFPTYQTLHLCLLVFFLVTSQLVELLSLNWDDSTFAFMNSGEKLLNSWAMAIFSRGTGMNTIDVSTLHAASLVFMVGMMYLAAYPLSVSIRTSVKTEDWLDEDKTTQTQESNLFYQAKHLMARDLIVVFLGWFIACITEKDNLVDDPINFTVFKVFFELVSAYGTVGLSMGYPGENYSFAGRWTTVGKLLLIVLMLRGRRRKLPNNLDTVVNFHSPMNNAAVSAAPYITSAAPSEVDESSETETYASDCVSQTSDHEMNEMDELDDRNVDTDVNTRDETDLSDPGPEDAGRDDSFEMPVMSFTPH